MNNLKRDINIIKGLIIATLVFSVFSFFNGCSNSNNIEENKQRIELINKRIDSNFYSKKELDLIFEIQGLKNAKRMLYHNNAIVRTKERPDDLMNEYSEKIDTLREKLKQIRRLK